jgi:hypothetical protein
LVAGFWGLVSEPLPGAAKGPKKVLQLGRSPEESLAVPGAITSSSRINAPERSGKGSKPSSMCQIGTPTTVLILPAWKAGDTPSGKNSEDVMKKWTAIAFLLFCMGTFPLMASAGNFDGSKTLLFTATKVFECTPMDGCDEVTVEEVFLPQFMKIDVKKKEISAFPVTKTPASKIERMETVDGKLILQGAEDGRESIRDGVGWTMAIAKDTGKVVLTSSGDAVAFIVFGACTPY